MKVSLEFGNKKVDQDQIEKGVEKMEKVNDNYLSISLE